MKQELGSSAEVLSRVKKFGVFSVGGRNRSCWGRIKEPLSKVD